MSTATPYLYSYGVGGVVFLVGLYFAWRHGYINGSVRGVRNLAACLFVMMFFMAIQGYLQFAADGRGSRRNVPRRRGTGGRAR